MGLKDLRLRAVKLSRHLSRKAAHTHKEIAPMLFPRKRLCMAGACNLRKRAPGKIDSKLHRRSLGWGDLGWSKMGSPPEHVASSSSIESSYRYITVTKNPASKSCSARCASVSQNFLLRSLKLTHFKPVEQTDTPRNCQPGLAKLGCVCMQRPRPISIFSTIAFHEAGR